MQCTNCGHLNGAEARFCSQCGTALRRQCPVCSHGVEPDARFCSNCGAGLATPARGPAADGPATPQAPADDEDLSRYVPAALLRKIREARASGSMRGERRTVTMLFADIQGSTAAAEHLDPEEWADIVNGAFEHLIAPVYRYEGTLARLQGDAILAFFGAPIAHEDDPLRAAHAGLEMIDAIATYTADVWQRFGFGIAVRVGINTGLVVVGEVGSDLRVEYTALGDAINVAARMEQTAEPGTVRVTRDTADLLGGAFELRPIGPVDVKGRAVPVAALQVVGRARGEAFSAAGPMVGRRHERQELRELLERVVAGVGGVATIVGDAGLGKSRLLAAAREDLASMARIASTTLEDGEVVWLEGHCRSFDTAVAYAPFLDLATHWLDLAGLDGSYARIADSVARVRGGPDLDMSAYLANMAGAALPADAERLVSALETPVLHDKTTTAVVAYLEALASRQPLVLVIDDLQWADALSLRLGELLMAAVERSPIALILAMRPAREDPSWRLAEVAARDLAHRHTSVVLEPLSDTQVEALLDALLGDRTVAPEARTRILGRADGNPLFVEEIVRSFGDDAAGDVPTSLTGLLTARLDRLGEPARRLAEVGAVVGQQFDATTVVPLVDGLEVDAALDELVRRGVLVERRRVPSRVYAFRHALLQETAYAKILLKERRSLHERLARHLAVAQPDAPHEIARHLLAADSPEAAFPWLVQAGVRAIRSMALAEAIRSLTTALDHLPADVEPGQVARAHLALGEAYSLIPDLDHAAATYQDLVAYGRACALPSLEVSALNRLGLNAATLASDYETATRYLQRARELAEETDDQAGLAEYHMNACFVAVSRGELEQAVEHDVETARIGRVAGVEQIRLAGLTRRATNLLALLDFDAAREALAEAREAAEALGDEEGAAVLLAQGEGRLRFLMGDVTGGLELARAAVAPLERYGSFFTAIVHEDVAHLELSLGDVEGAIASFAESVRLGGAQGQASFTSVGSSGLALCYALCGDASTSQQHRAAALQQLGRPMGGFLASTVWADLGFANIALSAWADAEGDFALGLEASASTRFLERPRLLVGAALTAVGRGDVERAGTYVEEGRAYLAEHDMPVFTPLLDHVAACVAHARGDLAGADRSLAAADEMATRFGLRLVLCDILAARAEVAAGTGDSVSASRYRQRRERLVEEISDRVADPDLRDRLAGRLHGAAMPS